MPRTKLFSLWALLAFLASPHSAFAITQWTAALGGQYPDCLAGGDADDKLAAGCEALQAMAFLPNEIWIHQNDSITWTSATDEGHTVALINQPQPATLGGAPYPPAQQRPSTAAGCSAYGSAVSLSGAAYDPGTPGSQCVNSGVLTHGGSFTVSFPAQGNFKFTCLIHAAMNGAVHVLAATAALPYLQRHYDLQAKAQLQTLTTEVIPEDLPYGSNRVFTVGKIVGTGGGWQYGSAFRFVDGEGRVLTAQTPLRIRKGQTVEFTNIDPYEPHTITFGCPNDDPQCVSLGAPGGGPRAFVDNSGPFGTAADSGRFAVLNPGFDPADERARTANSKYGINSGFLVAGAQDRATGSAPLSGLPATTVPLAQVSPSVTHFRLTFNALGNYRFICELHDEIGMIGWVNVVP